MKPKNKCLPCLILDSKQYIFNYLNLILFEKIMKNHQKALLVKILFNLFYILMEFSMKIALLMKKESLNTMTLIVRTVSQMI